MANRLKLDFSITSAADRKVFIDNYLTKINFTPNEEELEMMANYILWGKTENGKSAVENHELDIPTRHQTWNKKKEESLDELMEQPTFNEAAVFGHVPTKTPRSTFSREDALQNAPAYLRETFEELFQQIDRLDLIINFYELEHGKRKKEPRAELLERFNFNQISELRQRAAELTQFKYLKMRHELVELRRTQYTLKDSYACPMQRALPQAWFREEKPEFEYNVDVFPLGVNTPGTFMELIFREEQQLVPKNFSEEELRLISTYY